MLSLSRKPGETIVIGDGVVLKVVLVRGQKVKLAIDAPKDVRVDRGEVAAAREGGRGDGHGVVETVAN